MLRHARAFMVSAVLLAGIRLAVAGEAGVVIAPPALDLPASAAHQASAVFAGGCFWGVQGVFQHVKGVSQALSGYAGGTAQTAHYEQVSEGNTGHAEAVQVTYDPAQVSYGQLLQVYFSVVHDPTELDRQGPDSGSQYRSTVFVADQQQREVAAAYIAQLDRSKAYPRRLATTVENLTEFYPAESYHQDYLARNPHSLYITINDQPKVANLSRLFANRYREQPALVHP